MGPWRRLSFGKRLPVGEWRLGVWVFAFLPLAMAMLVLGWFRWVVGREFDDQSPT